MFVLKNPEINVFMSNKKVDALGFNELSIWVSKTHARMKLMENKEQRYSVSH
jgi:small-conductance mechanosensitive channel